MPTYDIYVKKTGTERHSVEAASPKKALERYNEGDADLKDDETDDVDSVTIVDRATGQTFDADELDNEAEGPEPVEYTVRIGVTVRAFASKSFEATSWEEAIAKALALDTADFIYTYERDGIEGDEIGWLGEADGDQDHELDLRKAGEPYSWTAVEIVKAMAAVDVADVAALAALVQRAKAACTKSTGDEG